MKILKLTKNRLEETEVNKLDLETYYKELNCSCIDILTLRINNKDYDLIIDDEGKLKEHEPVMLWITEEGKLVDYLATGALICNWKKDEEGEIIEDQLNDDDLKAIRNYFRIHYQEGLFIYVLN